MKRFKRCLTFFLVLSLVLGSMPVNASADMLNSGVELPSIENLEENLTSEDDSAVSISLSDSLIQLQVGDTYMLTYELLPDDTDLFDVAWLSSDVEIAVVDEGLVTAVAEGEVEITAHSAEDASIAAVCVVEVMTKDETGLTQVAIDANKTMMSSAITSNKITISVRYDEEDGLWWPVVTMPPNPNPDWWWDGDRQNNYPGVIFSSGINESDIQFDLPPGWHYNFEYDWGYLTALLYPAEVGTGGGPGGTLIFGKDTYSFNNVMFSFGYSLYNLNEKYNDYLKANKESRYYITDSDYLKLKSYVEAYYSKYSAKKIMNKIDKEREHNWAGSCYGMAVTTALDFWGQVNFKKNYGSNAPNLYSIKTPLENYELESAINYYFLVQVLPSPIESKTYLYDWSTLWNWGNCLESLVTEVKNRDLVLLNYSYKDKVDGKEKGHSILIFGYRKQVDGSHSLIAYDNNKYSEPVTIKISSDYSTIVVGTETKITQISSISDFSVFDIVDIDGPNNDMKLHYTSGDSTVTVVPAKLYIPARGNFTITNAAGETLTYTDGLIDGSMVIEDTSIITRSDVDGAPGVTTLVFDVADSTEFTFSSSNIESNFGVLTSDMYAEVDAINANQITIGQASLNVSGDNIDYDAYLAVDKDYCDMVALQGTGASDLHIADQENGILATGVGDLNSISSFYEHKYINNATVSTNKNSLLIVDDLVDTTGKVNVLVSSNDDNDYDTQLDMTLLSTTDSRAVETDKFNLTWNTIKGTNTSQNNVTSNLTLPTTGANDTTITWESANSAISNTGVVTRPISGSSDATGTLTATITKGDASDTVVFTLIVTAQPTGSNNGGGGGGGIVTSTCAATFETNGGSAIAKVKVNEGDKLSKPVDPIKDGFIFAGWFTDKELTKEYDFATMVTDNFTLYARWTKEDKVIPEPEWINPFTDVKPSDWFYDPVEYAITYGLFYGTSATIFAPNDTMTRAMLVTVLWRSAGSPAASDTPFTDVQTGQWYSDAVTWAAQSNIVSGIGNGLFAPNAEITREQMAVMLYNYSKHIDVKLPQKRSGTFMDETLISPWAKEAVAAMYAAEIINGKDQNNFDPQGDATRAEVATMMRNFLEIIGS